MIIRVPLTRPTAPERRLLAITVVAALVPFVLLGIWAHYNAAASWEAQVVSVLAVGKNLPGDVVLAINSLGNLENWAVLLIVLAIAVAYLRGIRAALVNRCQLSGRSDHQPGQGACPTWPADR